MQASTSRLCHRAMALATAGFCVLGGEPEVLRCGGRFALANSQQALRAAAAASAVTSSSSSTSVSTAASLVSTSSSTAIGGAGDAYSVPVPPPRTHSASGNGNVVPSRFHLLVRCLCFHTCCRIHFLPVHGTAQRLLRPYAPCAAGHFRGLMSRQLLLAMYQGVAHRGLCHYIDCYTRAACNRTQLPCLLCRVLCTHCSCTSYVCRCGVTRCIHCRGRQHQRC